MTQGVREPTAEQGSSSSARLIHRKLMIAENGRRYFSGRFVLKNSEFCGTALLLIGVAEVRLGRERVPSFTPSPF